MWSDRLESQVKLEHSEPFLYVNTPEEMAAGAPVEALWRLQGNGSKAACEQAEKTGFERGVREGELRARGEMDQEIKAMRGSLVLQAEEFHKQRKEYFDRIEPEVVQLSLAIAKKIIHREAQIDPLLLTGMVHVALAKLDSGTQVRLRAHPEDIHLWQESFSQTNGTHPAPELIGDATLQRGECALETEMGSTQISLETHLKEIEQGFFDLLEQRPRAV